MANNDDMNNLEWRVMDCVSCNGHGTMKTTKDFVLKDCPVCEGSGWYDVTMGQYDTCLVAQGHLTGDCSCGGSKESQDKEIEKRLIVEEKLGL